MNPEVGKTVYRTRLHRLLGWGSIFAPTDIHDPATGDPLYVWAAVRPRWHAHVMRLRLFLGIVWRDYHGGRVSARTAWDVAAIVHDGGILDRDPHRG